MFRSAFISEYSISTAESTDNILKSHLLSNQRIVIPAAAINSTKLGEIVNENLEHLGGGAIAIAHGSDRENLKEYIDKYPEIKWDSQVIDLFSYFDGNNLCSVYDTKNTITQFNKLMRSCASGEIKQYKSLFNNNGFCNEVLNQDDLFDLNAYFLMIDNHVHDFFAIETLKSHAKYFYNYFGSFSTESGNTFSLESTTGFNYISSGFSGRVTELDILISSALDLTDGIEDFDFLSNLNNKYLDRLSYNDILEIRQNWLHDKVIDKYDAIIKECASSYIRFNEGNVSDAIAHIDNAFEIRRSILEKINLSVKVEINAYKLHRFSRFLSDTAISSIGYLSGVDLTMSIYQWIQSATTEVAVLINREKEYKKLIDSKLVKLKQAHNKAETVIGVKSPVTEYLRLIEGALVK